MFSYRVNHPLDETVIPAPAVGADTEVFCNPIDLKAQLLDVTVNKESVEELNLIVVLPCQPPPSPITVIGLLRVNPEPVYLYEPAGKYSTPPAAGIAANAAAIAVVSSVVPSPTA